MKSELDAAIKAQTARHDPKLEDASIVFRVKMGGVLQEDEWEKTGLSVVSSDPDNTLVLLAKSEKMEGLRGRLEAYEAGPAEGNKNAPYNQFVSSIEEITELSPDDRIGFRFKADGITKVAQFDAGKTYLVDIELWDLGRREARSKKIDEIETYINRRNGETLEKFVGQSITMMRVRVPGDLLQSLLSVGDISTIDLPPQPDVEINNLLETTLGDAPPVNTVVDEAPVIGVLDSGVNRHPFIEDILVGSIGVPDTLGEADDFGHGTRVAGVAAFGDLRAQWVAGTLNPGSKICSAKVVNSQGRFDDLRLVASQMAEAIPTLHGQFGCRIFVLALCDSRRPYDGGKVGSWAAILDELARELDVVIIVAAGNRNPRIGNEIMQAETDYPNYLLEPQNRIFEPGGAVNVLTVGSLSHGEGMDRSLAEYLHVRPITRADQPSPFSRVGPGVGGSVKPDLVEIGGTMLVDPTVGRLRWGNELPAAGIVTLRNDFQVQLLTTGSGTSYAAPRVAFIASQILSQLPKASANLIRALIISSAEVPEPAIELLRPHAGAAKIVCGHGRSDLERAAFSDSHRVTFFAEGELGIDQFEIFEVPIPELFQTEKGDRNIRITLAYDPPVRHTRNDYAGVNMSYRLLRGCDQALVTEHFRKRKQKEGPPPDITKHTCDLKPGPQTRDIGTVQRSSVTYKRDISSHGDKYYLVVRCESGWKTEGTQRFALVVELSHSARIEMYERIREQVRVRI